MTVAPPSRMFDGGDIFAYFVPRLLLGLLGVYVFCVLVRPLAKTRFWWVPGAVPLLGAMVRFATLPEYGAGFETLAGMGLLALGSTALVTTAVARSRAVSAPAGTSAIVPVAPMPIATLVRHRSASAAHPSTQGE